MEPSEERESTPSITVPETDMDTQSSLGRTEGSEVIEPVSPPPSRESSEMPQVSQSQEVYILSVHVYMY